MTVEQARKIVGNQSMHCIINMKFALSLHSWSNTPAECERLEACKVLIRAWKRGRK